MSKNTLNVFGFVVGVLAGFGCMAALIGIFGEHYFGMTAVSVFVGIAVGGFTQRSLIKRFMPKAINND